MRLSANERVPNPGFERSGIPRLIADGLPRAPKLPDCADLRLPAEEGRRPRDERVVLPAVPKRSAEASLVEEGAANRVSGVLRLVPVLTVPFAG